MLIQNTNARTISISFLVLLLLSSYSRWQTEQAEKKFQNNEIYGSDYEKVREKNEISCID